MTKTSVWRVPFFRHDLGAAELAQLAEVLKGDILTTGEYVARFERKLADYLGRKHVLAVSSCTGALHLSLLALDVGRLPEECCINDGRKFSKLHGCFLSSAVAGAYEGRGGTKDAVFSKRSGPARAKHTCCLSNGQH